MRTLDARRILPRFAVAPLTVRRKATGTFVKGRYVPSSTETVLTIAGCSLQPMGAKELELLPEGFRTKQVVKVYTPEELRTADAEAGHEADRVEYKGETFEVHSVEDWDDHGRFWKAICVKQGQ